MSYLRYFVFAISVSAVVPVWGQSGFPFQNETLRYSINWPSGLSLGDATFTAQKTEAGWTLETSIQAGVPGFLLADKYRSLMTAEHCSLELARETSRGGRKTREKTTFDQHKLTAHRATEGGGSSDFNISPCARDALAFLYFARREMGQGRVAPAQTVYLGSAYSVRLEYTGPANVRSGDKQVVSDRTMVTIKGPKVSISVEVFFARDAARTPLVIRVPMAIGNLSVELVR